MQNEPVQTMEMFPLEVFKVLLDHEVNKSRRYGDSLTLIDLLIETDPADPGAQHQAETLAISTLHLHLREVDIPSRRENEFFIMMPCTSMPGARTACERVRTLMDKEYQTEEGMPFKLITFIGMAGMPNDRSLTGDELARYASQALQYARLNQIRNVITYSEIPK